MTAALENSAEKIIKVHTCEIRDNNDNKIAVRYFRTHDEAVAEQNRLLSYEWVGYMAAPIVSAYKTTPKALEELVRSTNAKIGEGE